MDDDRIFLRFNLTHLVEESIDWGNRVNPLMFFELEILRQIKKAEKSWQSVEAVWTYSTDPMFGLILYLEKDFFKYMKWEYTPSSKFRFLRESKKSDIQRMCLNLETFITGEGKADEIIPLEVLESSIRKGQGDPGGIRVVYYPKIHLYIAKFVPRLSFTWEPLTIIKPLTFYGAILAGIFLVIWGIFF
ncbi:hypothetical protein NXZ84_14800 [Mechercharimyces sp. CAU 1602]|nr:hypothetical protein [Mechercharimyces sp. CAU 1602]